MSVINTVFGIPFGYLMYLLYQLSKNYGMAILLFTLVTKILMFPLSLISQKNAIIMAKIQPALDDIRRFHAGNNPLIMEEQKKLFKEEGYSTWKSLVPLLVQIPIILGLIHVIYHPLQHILRLDAATLDLLLNKTAQLLNTSREALGSGAELKIIEMVAENPALFQGMSGVEKILALDMQFLGADLSHIPSFSSLLILFPILSGASALLLAVCQNRHYVLQITQSAFRKWSISLFLVAFSFFFALILPAGVGLYWIAGNLLSVAVLFICNGIYDPKKLVPESYFQPKGKRSRKEKEEEKTREKAKKARQKEDRRRFMAIKGKQLVFYAENASYYRYFKGFIDYILKHSELVIHYVTSDPEDPVLRNDHPRLLGYYIGPVALISFMMRLDADMLVMTMPDLETYHIKRSIVRKDVEYVYLDHGMTSFHLMLKKGALDHFDTIFCYGPNHADEVRETERVYGLPRKKLVKTGYPLLDQMIEGAKALGPIQNDPKVIMIAPSWQKDNIMDFCLDDLIMPLLQTDYRVILRPHPEYVKRFPDKMERLKMRYEKHLGPYFDIQTEYQKTESVYSADLVITDWSSIAQEFSYATKKPSLFINTPMKIMNPEYQKIPLVPLDISLRDEIGRSLDLEQLDTLPALIESLMNEGEAWCRRIEQVVSDNIYDVGRAAEGGGRYIIETLSKKKHVQKENDEKQNALLELDNTWEAMRSQLSQEEAVMLLKQLEDFQKITKEQEDDHA